MCCGKFGEEFTARYPADLFEKMFEARLLICENRGLGEDGVAEEAVGMRILFAVERCELGVVSHDGEEGAVERGAEHLVDVLEEFPGIRVRLIDEGFEEGKTFGLRALTGEEESNGFVRHDFFSPLVV